MHPEELARSLAACESLSQRFVEYLKRTRYARASFDSVEEFERYEANPGLARNEQPPVSAPAVRAGVVYLAKGNDFYKIGRSSRMESRESYLTTKLPFPVEIIHTITAIDSVAVERYWHGRFAHLRTRGEWFSLTEIELAEFLQHKSM